MSPVHWPLAVSVAGRVAGSYPLEGSYHEARFADQAPGMVARAAALVAEETRLPSPGMPQVAVVGRSAWVENNVRSFSVLLQPAAERLESRGGIGGRLAGRAVAVEIGLVLGLLAKRVLGQYELVLPTGDEESGDTIFFVGPNILWMERQFEFRPEEFRFWVALHECTHRMQFVGVPWLRDYFLGLVSEMAAGSVPEPGRVARVIEDLRRSAAAGDPLVDETGLLGLFASEEQREVLDRVQALMSLLEGHGHVVMDRIGARELVTQSRMSAVLKRRRQDPRTATLMRFLGMEMKLRQYELGERFIAGIERHAGWEALDRVWAGSEALPTLAEIENPVLWLERMG